MDNYYKNKYYTLDKIPKHRIDYVEKRVKIFIEDFKLTHWPLDCVELILEIEKGQTLPIQIKSISNLSNNFDAATVYSKENNNFLIVVNKSKIYYPFKISNHRKLNFTLAHELGHIYLLHHELPENCKTEKDLYIEELEADEFAGKILMPKNKIFTSNFTSIKEIATYFNVSESAVLKRLTNIKYSNLTYSRLKNYENIKISF
ncbi:ImmA/IrrE family metallo-endopeptidase [Clostridium sporogenes]|uniref:ImmA/IrrE family metallo-endopeptidase n=1 Tax=Clostridium botulinum TaxID=1491 RepID=A0A6M0SUQ7_CLOBO|nr:ImmA/IrrE family metallo-endopeptidase [Clostridium sporogenes]NFA58944.1 ImmA/IrrE family metallo-endopeptidase [Clostridium botulinum]NFI73527.1 ImmA/IrrE family metallo-endopeptidase [Clostridium sporogenes]NFL71578.1 ImmA/IrrE family metallo-endopeptidase [Clostridium sporogenes]NFM24770.1 ImmA/IrrE family metallo-endopeptidase [Clostridium sporogenes]NFP61225.1 ImmA/IrrE family metallo-endopeptidase [Clostridium sporogenes]